MKRITMFAMFTMMLLVTSTSCSVYQTVSIFKEVGKYTDNGKYYIVYDVIDRQRLTGKPIEREYDELVDSVSYQMANAPVLASRKFNKSSNSVVASAKK